MWRDLWSTGSSCLACLESSHSQIARWSRAAECLQDDGSAVVHPIPYSLSRQNTLEIKTFPHAPVGDKGSEGVWIGCPKNEAIPTEGCRGIFKHQQMLVQQIPRGEVGPVSSPTEPGQGHRGQRALLLWPWCYFWKISSVHRHLLEERKSEREGEEVLKECVLLQSEWTETKVRLKLTRKKISLTKWDRTDWVP